MLCNTGPVFFLNQYAVSGKTEREQRGVVGPIVSGSMDIKRGTVISSVWQLKPPPEDETTDRKGPDHTQESSYPQQEEVQDLLPLNTLGITVSFYSLYFQVHPTVSHVSQERGGESEGKLLHAFRQPISPQSVLMWSSSSLCVSEKEQKKRRDWVKEKGRGILLSLNGFLHSPTVPNQSYPRGPRCSVPSVNLQVIRGQVHSTRKDVL